MLFCPDGLDAAGYKGMDAVSGDLMWRFRVKLRERGIFLSIFHHAFTTLHQTNTTRFFRKTQQNCTFGDTNLSEKSGVRR